MQDDVCWFPSFFRWGWRTDIFQLSGFHYAVPKSTKYAQASPMIREQDALPALGFGSFSNGRSYIAGQGSYAKQLTTRGLSPLSWAIADLESISASASNYTY